MGRSVSLLPRSLFARLFLLMVLVLSLAQVAALAIHLEDRRQLMQEVLGQHSAQRIAVAAGSVAVTLRVRLLGETDGPRPPSDAAPAARRLAEHLGEALGADRPVRVRLLAPEAAAPMRHRMPHGDGPGHGWMSPMAGVAALRVEVRLADGSWVGFDRPVPAGLYDWPMRMLASLGLVLVVTLVAVFYAARRLTRPLRRLAAAADVLGRDLHAEPLAEAGPTEIRLAARAFNRMQQRLQAYVEERTRMLAAISHDLKTPLTRLRLRLELLEDERRAAPLVRDLDEMEAMLKSSLAFARGVRSEPMAPVDLSELLRQLAADYLGAGQPGRQRAALRRGGRAGPAGVERCGRDPLPRPRPRHCRGLAGPGVRAVPARRGLAQP